MATMRTIPTVSPMPAVAIDLLDTLDGPDDPTEPDFTPRSDGRPGDPDDYHSDQDEEAGAYAEWTSIGIAQRRQGNCLIRPGGHEDDENDDASEEDDPAGQADEDGVNTSVAGFYRHGLSYTGPGCPISDPGEIDSRHLPAH